MTTLPGEKLAKLIPLLGSDQPGEVFATAQAIGRLLKSCGYDWHWLAKALPAAPAPGSIFAERQSAWERQRADMARAFYDESSNIKREAWAKSTFSTEDILRAEEKVATNDVRRIRRLADQMLGSGKLSADQSKFVRSMKIRAQDVTYRFGVLASVMWTECEATAL